MRERVPAQNKSTELRLAVIKLILLFSVGQRSVKSTITTFNPWGAVQPQLDREEYLMKCFLQSYCVSAQFKENVLDQISFTIAINQYPIWVLAMLVNVYIILIITI